MDNVKVSHSSNIMCNLYFIYIYLFIYFYTTLHNIASVQEKWCNEFVIYRITERVLVTERMNILVSESLSEPQLTRWTGGQ